MSAIARLVRWFAVSLGATVASSAGAEPRKPTHIACVGDSITYGAESSNPTTKSYPAQLQGLLGNSVQVKNFGNSGSTMLSAGFGDKPYVQQAEYTAATTFVSNAGASAVVSVIIILGANDSKPYNWDPAAGKNDQQYLKDYRAMVEHFAGLATKPTIYLGYPLATGTNPCCSIRGNVIHDEQIPLIKQLAMEKHLPIIDLNTPTTNHPEYFADGVHPNDNGYLVLANLVKKGLEREPTVSITSPATGVTVGAGMLPLATDASGDTVEISSVELFEGVTSLGKSTAKPFTLNWVATPGAHQITAKATDTTLANATSAPVSFTVVAAGGGAAGNGGAAGASGAGGAGGGNDTAGSSSGGLASAGAGAGGAPVFPTAGAAGSSTSGAPAGGAGGAMSTPSSSTPSPVDDSGCSCSAPGSPPSAGGAWLLASLLGLAALRRRDR